MSLDRRYKYTLIGENNQRSFREEMVCDPGSMSRMWKDSSKNDLENKQSSTTIENNSIGVRFFA
jgi:hypothetical protein